MKIKVANKLEERQVASRVDGSSHRVAEALVGDETGCILLTLWDDLINQVATNDIFTIENGYISTFKGTMRLNVGRFGKLAKAEGDVASINSENNLSERIVEEAPGERRFGGGGRFDRRGGRF